MRNIICIIVLLTLTSCAKVESHETESNKIPVPVLNFIGLEEAILTLNPRAPVETKQFGQLAGIWYCNGLMSDPTGKADKVPFKAYWAWKYILDGFAVQDYFYQGENEFLYWSYFKRDSSLTQLRVFDPAKKQWNIAFITDSAGEIPGRVSGNFTAQNLNDELVMTYTPTVPENNSRIVFYNINESSFDWRTERSDDNDETWVTSSSLACEKVTGN